MLDCRTGCSPALRVLHPAKMAALLDRLYNLHWVTPEVARSAQPYLGFYGPFVGAHGIRSIINLRGENPTRLWWRQERRTADRLDIRHFDVRLSSRLIPSRNALADLMDAFENAPRPFLIKCSGGQDRTSFAAASYLLHIGGPSALERAQAQFALWPYLHRPRRNQRWMRYFPAFAGDAMGSAPFAEWLRHDYDPNAFAEWLARKGEGSSFLALQKS